MYFYVDAYNFIFSMVKSEKNLKSIRQEVINFLQKEFARKNLKGTLVFDGAHIRGEESGLSYPNPLKVAFAPKGQSADEYIVERIELAKNPKDIVVVTNDRGLIRHVRSHGAKTESTDAFLERIQKRKKPAARREPQDSPANIERLLKIFEKKLEDEES